MSTTTSDFLRHLRTLAARQANGLLSDQQLLERFLDERSEASFAALVQRHGAMVLSACRRVLHHEQDAEDAFQATFLILARQASSIRKRESLGSWLHGVAYHSAERLKAKALRRAAHEGRLPPRPPGDAMDDITWHELRSVLDEELRRLPEQYRAPLVLCYLEARTQDEAARRLGWSKSTFGRRLERARQLLAQRLTRRGLTLTAALTAPVLLDSAATAAVPPLLAACTVRAGLALANGQSLAALVSASVAVLAESGGKALWASKVKWALVLLAAVGVGIGGVYTHSALGVRQAAEQPAAPPQAKITPPPARSASKDKAIEIKGRVLDPDGKPFAGANLFLPADTKKPKSDVAVRATTDKDGRFSFNAKPPDFNAKGKATLVATAKGFGPAWIEVTAQKKEALPLRLVEDDVPIVGRILDLEGRPVAGVRVTVAWLYQGDIKPLLEPGKGGKTRAMRSIGPVALEGPVSVQTGEDGRFRLSGFGRDRIVLLMVRGEGIEDADLTALTHAGPVNGTHYNRAVSAATFTHIAAPTKPIVGTVRDKRTGKPLAGIRVVCPSRTYDWCRATTDDKGRYRVVGLDKRENYMVGAGGAPYFCTTKFIDADTPGLEPISVDFALERGVTVTGRVTDKATGLPVRGDVNYLALADNANLNDFTDYRPAGIGSVTWQGKIAADGTFTVVCVPGPGLLYVQADDDNYVRARRKGYKIAPGGVFIAATHAVVRIDPSEQDAKSRTCAIALEPGRSLGGTLAGPDGQPVAGAHAAGLRSVPNYFYPPEKLETAGFTVGGLSPKQPRVLVFVHPEKKLAKVHTIRGDEKEPLTVRLEAMGTLSGRIVDAKGLPRAGLKVAAAYRFLEERERCIHEGKEPKDLPWELLLNSPMWSKIINRETTTDKDGTFRLDRLVPGVEYDLAVRDGQTTVFNREHLSVQSGKVNDLGDLKPKPDPAKEGEK